MTFYQDQDLQGNFIFIDIIFRGIFFPKNFWTKVVFVLFYKEDQEF